MVSDSIEDKIKAGEQRLAEKAEQEKETPPPNIPSENLTEKSPQKSKTRDTSFYLVRYLNEQNLWSYLGVRDANGDSQIHLIAGKDNLRNLGKQLKADNPGVEFHYDCLKIKKSGVL